MRTATALLLAIAAGAPAAHGDVTTYTTQAAFASATASLATEAFADFDAFADATPLPSGTTTGGVTFTYVIGDNVQLMAVGGFQTISSPNSLGTSNGFVFLAGDAFTMSFPPSTAVGLYVIAEDLLPGHVVLQAPVGEVENGDAEGMLPGTSISVFFLGIVESDPGLAFTTATVTSIPVETAGDFVWNVDNVEAAPEPGALGAAAAAALGLVAQRRRRVPA